MKKLVCLLAGLVLAVTAQAAIQITYSIDGGGVVTCTNAVSAGPVVCPNVSGPTLNISLLSADSNSPGTAPLSLEESTTLHINNVTGATHKIVITVASQDFTLPTAPPDILLNSHIGGTVIVGKPANALSFQSCVDATNSLNGCPGTIQSPVGSPSVTSALSFSNDQFKTIPTLGAPYALDELITLTLGGGGQINFSASTTLTQVPEPASIALLGGALLFGASRLIRRKRNQSLQA
jgi:hypothetical protein